MLNKDKPHGMSSKNWNKKYPDQNKKALMGGKKKKKGGADLRINFGNDQQYDTMPMENLPFTAYQNTSASMGVVATDADTVNTVAPSSEYLSKVTKKRTKKMKTGFIDSADPTNNLVQDAAYVAPGKLIAKAEVPVERERHEPIMTKGKPIQNPNKKGGAKGKRKMSESQKVKAARNLSNWQNYYKELNKQPFMKKIKKHRVQAGSLVFELKKECDDCDMDFDFNEVIQYLNDMCSKKVKSKSLDYDGGSVYKNYDVNDINNMLQTVRKNLAKNGARIPMESMKAKQMQKKYGLV